MSLQVISSYSVPEETARVARLAFTKGNLYLRLYDGFGQPFADSDFAKLYPKLGQPAISSMRWASATLLQYLEGLSDRDAANNVRGRIDWKYLLVRCVTLDGIPDVIRKN